jgi:hypothetical protein
MRNVGELMVEHLMDTFETLWMCSLRIPYLPICARPSVRLRPTEFVGGSTSSGFDLRIYIWIPGEIRPRTDMLGFGKASGV